MSFRVPGSMLDQLHPYAVVEGKYFLGSGSSHRRPAGRGFTAAMLSRDPSLTPDEVKYLFTSEAIDLKETPAIVDGNGKIRPKDVARNLKESSRAHPSKRGRRPSPPAARASSPPMGRRGPVGRGPAPPGPEARGRARRGPARPGPATWSAGTWSGATWSGATWSGATWSGATWSAGTWSGATWFGATWSGATWSTSSFD